MNSIKPFEVGTMVKWYDDGREGAGIVIEVRTHDNRVAEGVVVPSYLIRQPDLSVVLKSHDELVVV